MTRHRHYDNLGTSRFVTFSCYRKRQYFKEEFVFRMFLEYLFLARQKHRFRLYGYSHSKLRAAPATIKNPPIRRIEIIMVEVGGSNRALDMVGGFLIFHMKIKPSRIFIRAEMAGSTQWQCGIRFCHCFYSLICSIASSIKTLRFSGNQWPIFGVTTNRYLKPDDSSIFTISF